MSSFFFKNAYQLPAPATSAGFNLRTNWIASRVLEYGFIQQFNLFLEKEQTLISARWIAFSSGLNADMFDIFKL